MYDLELRYYKKEKVLRVHSIDGIVKAFGEVDPNNIEDHPALLRWFDVPLLRYRKSDIKSIKIY